MARLRRTSAAVLLACAVLGTTVACNDKAPAPGAHSHHASSSPTAHEHPAPYAATLELADIGSGGQVTPAPGQPVLVTVTNTGTKTDAFLLQLRPPDLGGVSPEGAVLKPGHSTEVRVAMLPPQSGQPTKVTMVAISRATQQEVGSLELAAPATE
jgi:hypothetical protein